MYHPPSPSTPNHPRIRPSGAAPNTPPSYGAATPGAPFMGTRPLPPSPSAHPFSVPPAPHMGTVQLPTQPPNHYGLYTPPASPARQPRNISLHPCLREGSEVLVYFNMRNPVQSVQLPHGVSWDTPASNPPTQTLHISAFFGSLNIVVCNPAYITVGDVLAQLQAQLLRSMGNGATTGIQALRNQVMFAGLAHTTGGVVALSTRPSSA